MLEWIQRAFRTPPKTRTWCAVLAKDEGIYFHGAVWVFRGMFHGKAKIELIADDLEIRKLDLANVGPSGEDRCAS